MELKERQCGERQLTIDNGWMHMKSMPASAPSCSSTSSHSSHRRRCRPTQKKAAGALKPKKAGGQSDAWYGQWIHESIYGVFVQLVIPCSLSLCLAVFASYVMWYHCARALLLNVSVCRCILMSMWWHGGAIVAFLASAGGLQMAIDSSMIFLARVCMSNATLRIRCRNPESHEMEDMR